MAMSKGKQPFEQDFIIITPTEMRVRQGIQDTRLGPPIIWGESENGWESSADAWDNEPAPGILSDEEYVNVWESTIERL